MIKMILTHLSKNKNKFIKNIRILIIILFVYELRIYKNNIKFIIIN